jgi:hypothetical protein
MRSCAMLSPNSKIIDDPINPTMFIYLYIAKNEREI